MNNNFAIINKNSSEIRHIMNTEDNDNNNINKIFPTNFDGNFSLSSVAICRREKKLGRHSTRILHWLVYGHLNAWAFHAVRFENVFYYCWSFSRLRLSNFEDKCLRMWFACMCVCLMIKINLFMGFMQFIALEYIYSFDIWAITTNTHTGINWIKIHVAHLSSNIERIIGFQYIF